MIACTCAKHTRGRLYAADLERELERHWELTLGNACWERDLSELVAGEAQVNGSEVLSCQAIRFVSLLLEFLLPQYHELKCITV